MITRDMDFDCKLAHNDQIKKISGFASVKELYERISNLFSVPTNEILYCTLNTHNFRDMDALLGNYLSIGDMIVVHMCGDHKEVSIKKTQEYLGLTITDNGNGRSFVKKIKANEDLSYESIKPGDHIASLNNESTIGMRHFEVAKALREVPQQTSFTLKLIEPLYKQEYLDGKFERNIQDGKSESDLKKESASISLLHLTENQKAPANTLEDRSPLNNQQIYENSNLESMYDDLTNSSLPIDRLLSKSAISKDESNELGANTTQDLYRHRIEKINTILESFLGINDNALAIQIYRLAKENKDSSAKFEEAIDSSELNVFNFGDDIKSYLWSCAFS